MMELPADVEDILSDDYEEGEILDGDNLYEEVSSLEEFSSGDEELSHLKNLELETDEKKHKHCTKHRRKDHKCKEDSVCRKERKGKHCYARIRKAKSSCKQKTDPVELFPQSNTDRIIVRKPDVTPIIKHLKCRAPSPYKSRPEPYPKIPHRYDYKDYHEKENRHNNKRYWATSPRNKMKPPEKYNHYNRNKINKENHYSKSRYQTPTPPPLLKIPPNQTFSKVEQTNTDNSFSKTSLLKRLVGSGTTGVKPIKENELVTVSKPVVKENESASVSEKSEDQTEKSNLDLDEVNEEVSEKEEIALITNGEDTSQPVQNETHDTSFCINREKIDVAMTEMILPERSKKIEMKWVRSMKDDKDELHLRVEALKSAWVKKFHERKKKGLIHQKKSDDDDIEDFLEDFALGSDHEDGRKEKTNEQKNSVNSSGLKKNSSRSESFSAARFNATDISGDNLKPEDMVIVNDRTNEEPIISETAVATADGNLPVFVDPLFIAGENFPLNSNHSQVSQPICDVSLSPTDKTISVAHATSSKDWHNTVDVKPNAQLSQIENHSLNNSQNLNKSKSKRTRWRKRRKSKSISIEATKNVANTSCDLDEEELRNLALLSVKSKNKTVVNQNDSKSVCKDSMVNVNIQEGKPEVTDRPTSSDNWEDEDLDEDILRARLLSSLTKPISRESGVIEVDPFNQPQKTEEGKSTDCLQGSIINTNILKPTTNIIKLPLPKKQTPKKLDRRKLRLNKKVWKKNISIRKTKLEGTLNPFGKSIRFHKNDSKSQLQSKMASSNIHSIPQVPQMIISVDDSDSSSDLDPSNIEMDIPLTSADSVPPEIEANIDLLLRQAELNSQLEKGVIDSSCNLSKQNLKGEIKKSGSENIKNGESALHLEETRNDTPLENNKRTIMTPTSSSSSSSYSSIPTPQALKHLPAWQQEEYKRLKIQIAEKERLLEATRSKIIEPRKDKETNGPIFFESKVPSDCGEDKNITCINPDIPPPTVSEEKFLNTGESSYIFSHCNGNMNDLVKAVSAKGISSPLGSRCINRVDFPNDSKFEKVCSTEENSGNKKSFPNLVSCTIMEEISVLSDIVNDFVKNNSEYLELKQKTARLKRILKVAESKMSVKKKKMFQIKDTITEKERQISSKISSYIMSPVEKNKPPSREMELVKLKHKEVSLRAQFLFHDFLTEKVPMKDSNTKSLPSISGQAFKSKETQVIGAKRSSDSKEETTLKKKIIVNEAVVVKNIVPSEKTKDRIEAPLKRNFSVKEREREEWDPNTPVCHYDLNGICKDEECKYQHFKTL